MIKEIQDYVLRTIQSILPEVKVIVGGLPIKEGVSIQLATGTMLNECLNRTSINRITIAINAKAEKQLVALYNLETIHNYFNRETAFPCEDLWQIITIKTNNHPVFLQQQENEYYIFGSSVDIIYRNKISTDVDR